MPIRPQALLPATLLLLATGCSQQDNRPTDTSLPDSGTPGVASKSGLPANPAPAGQASNGPTGTSAPGGAGSPSMGMPPAAGGAPAGAMSAEATKLSEQVKTLEAKLKASPGDAATKKQLSAKLYELGANIMNDPNLPPRQKYPDALKLYNQALAQDPANAEAKQGKDLIEGIYKQMGRPIPK